MQIRRSEEEFLQLLRQQVEQQLNWGSSVNWRNQDFVKLSEMIFEKTAVRLSSTTLKRLWGKLSYSSRPSTQTLDTLAGFIDLESWTAFKAGCADQLPAREVKPSVRSKKVAWPIPFRRASRASLAPLGLTLLLLIVLAFGLSFVFQNQPSLNSETLSSIRFSSHPVTQGLPNTVIFNYDVSMVAADSVHIQQSWDVNKRFAVSKEGKEASAIYYYPGYWRAKLLVDGQVVKEHDVYIKTEGWLPIIELRPIPRYLLSEELTNDGVLAVREPVLEQLQHKPQWINYRYVDDFGDLRSDHFSVEAKFRNLYERGDGICRLSRLIILGTDGVANFPFSIPGCVGDLRLRFGEIVHDARDYDLSAFGVDYKQWQQLQVIVKDKKVKVFLNKNLIHELRFQKDIGKVAGLSFRFLGAGAIDDVILRNGDGREMLSSDFES